MMATVQVVDLDPIHTLRALGRRPKPGDTPGLRMAEAAVFAPLAPSGPPPIRRAGLIAFWDSEEAFDEFLDDDPIAERFTGGVQARLRPLRAYGSWPGLPEDVPVSRAVRSDGPVVVLTLGRLRIPQAVRFLRTSRPAERAAAAHPGLVWGSAAARPPFVATVSVWRNAQVTAAYAYGHQQPAHSDAIAAQQRKDFHHESAFVRFSVTRLEGALSGSNPLVASDVAA
jgi:heme-degrading monooxygenase HmoA